MTFCEDDALVMVRLSEEAAARAATFVEHQELLPGTTRLFWFEPWMESDVYGSYGRRAERAKAERELEEELKRTTVERDDEDEP